MMIAFGTTQIIRISSFRRRPESSPPTRPEYWNGLVPRRSLPSHALVGGRNDAVTNIERLVNSSTGAVFRAKQAGKARQYWCFAAFRGSDGR